ncbi:hypothetical protein [Diaphorobacter sp.]|uniref:hypothetical protein n=1 Tax=Diaphorobacter sp. TaxID=1934310 RepID=UPI0025832735|nr:hypothetical protein [Diaphorobacter sp.]
MLPRHPPLLAAGARAALIAAALLPLAGCEIPGMGPDPRVAQREAEAKAIGGACRHALRGLEDCFTLNPKAPKAQVFAGWKDMDLYMRENKIEGTASVLTQLEKKPAIRRASDEEADLQTEDRTSRNRS